MFKCIHDLAPSYLCNEITMAIEVQSRFTRNLNENNVFVPVIAKSCTGNAFSYCGPRLWNTLPDDMKECSTIDVFKAKARFHFLQKTYL